MNTARDTLKVFDSEMEAFYNNLTSTEISIKASLITMKQYCDEMQLRLKNQYESLSMNQDKEELTNCCTQLFSADEIVAHVGLLLVELLKRMKGEDVAPDFFCEPALEEVRKTLGRAINQTEPRHKSRLKDLEMEDTIQC